MSLQTVKDSPRCTVCGQLTSNKQQHIQIEHGALLSYHLLQQMGLVLKGKQNYVIFDDLEFFVKRPMKYQLPKYSDGNPQ